MVILLTELASIPNDELQSPIQRVISTLTNEEFLGAYYAFLNGGMFSILSQSQNIPSQDSQQTVYKNVHRSFVTEMKFRRLNHLRFGDMVTLLKFYVFTRTF